MNPEFTATNALANACVPAVTADGAGSTASAAAAPALPPHTVTLDTPILRGSQHVTHVTLRRPLSGELRGLSLASLLQLDVANLQMLLPRITSPMLTRAEIDQLDPADLVQLGVEVTGFFLTRADRLPLSPTA